MRSKIIRLSKEAKQAAVDNFHGVKVQKLLVGRCSPCIKKNATRVTVSTLELDTFVRLYFKRNDVYYAYDPHKLCKGGDLVLIKELPEKKTTLITHELIRILFPLGDITCPLTGRKVVNTFPDMPRYRDEYEEIIRLYGENKDRFRYEDAPPRGWQENKKDFTHQDSYVKYHETEEPQPFSIYPYK